MSLPKSVSFLRASQEPEVPSELENLLNQDGAKDALKEQLGPLTEQLKSNETELKAQAAEAEAQAQKQEAAL
jgi:hypothetical protein